MSKFAVSSTLSDFGPVTQSLIRRIGLHYRAELVEALMRGTAAPSGLSGKESKRQSTAEAFLKLVGDTNRAQRRKMIRWLMTQDTGDRALSDTDQAWLKRHVDAKAKGTLVDRTDLIKDIANIVAPPEKLRATKGGLPLYIKSILGQIGPQKFYEPVRWPIALLDLFPGDQDGDQGGDQDTGQDSDQDDGGTGSNSGGQGTPQFNGLQLHIDRMLCADDTSEVGRDEINFAAYTVHADVNANQTFQFDGQSSGIMDAGQFNRGTINDFSPTRIVADLDMTGVALPRMVSAFFFLAEIDQGGFEDYMNEIRFNLGAELDALWPLIAQGAGPLAAWTVVLFVVGGPIVGAISAAMTLIVAGVLAIFNNRDEIFPPSIFTVILEPDAPNGPPFFGSNRTQPETVAISDFGGTYEVLYFWELT